MRWLWLLLVLLWAPVGAQEEPVRMLLVGPPGAGKGTQARILCQKFSLEHISTGDLLREQVRQNTELGKQASEYMNSGRLVPDELIISIVKAKLAQSPGFVLDGFPRSENQARLLDQMLEELGRPLNLVLLLEVPDEELVQRLSLRRSCPKCDRSYHLINNKPHSEGVCDVDGTPLVQRKDDQEETIRRRLKVYHDQTEPVVRYYRDRIGVVSLDGRQDIQSVQRAAIEAVESLGKVAH